MFDWLTKIISLVGSLAAIFLEGVKAGKNKAKVDAQKKVLDNVEKSKKIENVMAAKSIDDQLKQLRDDIKQ